MPNRQRTRERERERERELPTAAQCTVHPPHSLALASHHVARTRRGPARPGTADRILFTTKLCRRATCTPSDVSLNDNLNENCRYRFELLSTLSLFTLHHNISRQEVVFFRVFPFDAR